MESACYAVVATINEEHNIFLAQNEETGKLCVKKVMAQYNTAVFRRLREHEIRGVPRILDLYEENGCLVLLEEYIPGLPLSTVIERGKLTEETCRAYLCELCDILHTLHSLTPPIVHRDIKPSNIMITPNGHVVLIDFNAAKQYTAEGTEDTVLLGTKGYAAPEQYGFGTSSPRTDIYALGVLMREMQAALPGNTDIFGAVIEKCTHMDPADRFDSVLSVKAAITGETDRNKGKKKLPAWVPPGFRTLTPWKMAVAGVYYLFMIALTLNLEVEGTTDFFLWCNRITFVLIFFSVPATWFDYLHIQRIIPLCRSRYWILRVIGRLLLNCILIIGAMILLLILETVL